MEPQPDPDREAGLPAWRERRASSSPNGFGEVDDEEDRWLRIAMVGDGDRPPAPAFIDGQPIRAGYRLVAKRGDQVQIEPTFACALASRLDEVPLRRLFDHLWGVDLALWRELGSSPASVLADRWLRSPGRRLVRELSFLGCLHKGVTADGETDCGLDAVWAASGARVDIDGESSPGAARWRDLHAAMPGESMSRWSPKGGSDDVATAFARLERGSPYCLRGAAIAWLLNRAVDRPEVDLSGVRQDLREILPGHLALALQCEEDAEPAGEQFAARLEEATLLHAACIAAHDHEKGRIRRAWHVARWIHGCLVRSPFVASDEERLRADLMAFLPPERPSIDSDDPLHPARFEGEGLRIEDLSLVAGVWAHYSRSGKRLTPTPSPLVRAIRRLAGRPLRHGERDAEASLARGSSNELGWSAPHIAPPWVARWLLTEWRIAWLAQVGDEVVAECLEVLATDLRFEWLAFVWRSEGSALSDGMRRRALDVWRALSARQNASPHAIASMATGLIRELDEADRELALAAIRGAAITWRPFLWDAWTEAALQLGSDPLAEIGFDGLRASIEAQDLDHTARLNAALLLLRRTAALRGSETGNRQLEHLRRISDEPPFRHHQGLQRELRRLGVR